MDPIVRSRPTPSRYHHWKLDRRRRRSPAWRWTSTRTHPLRPGYALKLNSLRPRRRHRARRRGPAAALRAPRGARAWSSTGAQRPRLLRGRQHLHARRARRTRSRSTSASSPTRRASASRTRQRARGHHVPRRAATAPPPAAATSWRWPATRSCSSTTATRRSACPRCRCSACCRAPAASRALVDKRKVRRDLADVFCTLAEGVKGKRAVEWRLVDEVVPRSQVRRRGRASARARSPRGDRRARRTGVDARRRSRRDGRRRRHRATATSTLDARSRAAHRPTLTVRAPDGRAADDAEALAQPGATLVAAARLPRARRRAAATCASTTRRSASSLLHDRAATPTRVLARDDALLAQRERLVRARGRSCCRRACCKRLDLTARTLFALVEPGSCFAGSLLELALAADRSYMLDDGDEPRRDRARRR